MGRKKIENSKAPTSTGNLRHVHQEPRYGLHLGELINQFVVNDRDLSIEKVAKRMGKGKSTFANKFSVPYYGSVYDLIDVSVATGHDFFAYPYMILKSKGINVTKFYTEGEMEQLRKENEHLKQMLQTKIEENETLRQLNNYLKRDLEERKLEKSY